MPSNVGGGSARWKSPPPLLTAGARVVVTGPAAGVAARRLRVGLGAAGGGAWVVVGGGAAAGSAGGGAGWLAGGGAGGATPRLDSSASARPRSPASPCSAKNWTLSRSASSKPVLPRAEATDCAYWVRELVRAPPPDDTRRGVGAGASP